MLLLSLHNITLDYNTFTDLSKLTDILIRHNGNPNIKACTCDYIWYLNTVSNSKCFQIYVQLNLIK